MRDLRIGFPFDPDPTLAVKRFSQIGDPDAPTRVRYPGYAASGFGAKRVGHFVLGNAPIDVKQRHPATLR